MDDNQLTDNEIKNIYKVLQESPTDIDMVNVTNFVNHIISTTFTNDFLLIDSKDLLHDMSLLNTKFLELILLLKKEYNYKNICLVFLVFCDYFDIDYNKTFIVLHDKLQKLICDSTKIFIGDEVYQRMINKTNPKDYKLTTIFDLIKK